MAPKLGLQPFAGFSQPTLTPAQQAALAAGFSLGQGCIAAYAASGNVGVAQPTGWSYPTKAGLYENQYLLRAALALIGLGANTPEVTVYAAAFVDKDGNPLDGVNNYTVTFPGCPPAQYFSSLTAYSTQNNLLMSNAYSNRSNLNFNATVPRGWNCSQNGSITLYVGSVPPGPQGSVELANWLPTAAVPFYVILRFYGPGSQVINGTYIIPPFVRTQQQLQA